MEPTFALGSQMETEVGAEVEPEAAAESRHGDQVLGSKFGEAKKRPNWRPKLGTNAQFQVNIDMQIRKTSSHAFQNPCHTRDAK